MQGRDNPRGEGFGRCPFGVAVEAERTFGGVTVASRVRAWSWRGADRQDDDFGSAEMTDTAFG